MRMGIALAVAVFCAAVGAAIAQITVVKSIDAIDELTAMGAVQRPDPVLAVGENYVVTACNSAVRIYEKDANLDLDTFVTFHLTDFFGQDAGDSMFDPRVVYDHFSGYFILSCLDVTGERGIRVAWVDEFADNPMDDDDWTKIVLPQLYTDTDVDCAGNAMLGSDQPDLGFDESFWWVASPLIGPNFDPPLPSVDGFDNIMVRIDKATGDELILFGSDALDADDVPLGCLTKTPVFNGVESACPARKMHATPSVDWAYFVGVAGQDTISCPQSPPEFLPATYYSHQALRFFAVSTGDDEDPEFRYVDVPVPCFRADADPVETSEGQIGFPGDGRITSAVYTVEQNAGFLYVIHAVTTPVTIMVDDDPMVVNRRVVRWYRFATNNWPDDPEVIPELEDSATFAAPVLSMNQHNSVAAHHFMPALAVGEDDGGNPILAIVWNRTSALEAVKFRATACMGAFITPAVLVSDSTPAVTAAAWGDYFDIVPDPAVPGRFWTVAQVMDDAGTPEDFGDDGFITRIIVFDVECE
jgi:hypothetical protein